MLCLQFLCDGLEDDMTLKWQAAHAAAEAKTHTQQEIDNYTRASGKMLLLHKLLPKLRAEGRQVSTTPICLVCLLIKIVQPSAL
jgi:chromodomain-helicase-DNA-binding protein 7